MAKTRFVYYEDRPWRITELARTYHLSVGTLAGRLNRFGESSTGIARALATGRLTPRQCGLMGAARSPWRYRVSPSSGLSYSLPTRMECDLELSNVIDG